ncbi:hypothetical protein [Dyadobacter frigoris]|uniref:hypothetical protein n=1 Tax=Dyadobacter frigoris TaxID=2576211 RepID=UPI001485A805|nr:hypothetical protein [Dyadobacter frigoris]
MDKRRDLHKARFIRAIPWFSKAESLAITLELIKDIRAMELISGLHICSIGSED